MSTKPGQLHFTTDDGEEVSLGDSRLDLPDNKAAANEAQNALVDIAQEKLPDGSRTEFRVAVDVTTLANGFHLGERHPSETSPGLIPDA